MHVGATICLETVYANIARQMHIPSWLSRGGFTWQLLHPAFPTNSSAPCAARAVLHRHGWLRLENRQLIKLKGRQLQVDEIVVRADMR